MNDTNRTVDLRRIFLGLQRQMVATLQTERDVIRHPGTKGASSELQWLNMLERYLPKRYCVDSAFVLDCEGVISEQVDLVVYDRQYSPFLLNQDGAKYASAATPIPWLVRDVPELLKAAKDIRRAVRKLEEMGS